MPIFEVMGIHEATKKKEEEIVFWPSWYVAEDTQGAAMKFIMDLTEDEKEEINSKRFKVLVRPF